MPSYPDLNKFWQDPGRKSEVEDYLIGIWIEDYCRKLGSKKPDIVVVPLPQFSYLFDIALERLIAAWGISSGKNHVRRDKGRMRDHPKGAGSEYHRGHAIAHTLGGGIDINLVPQLGILNIGAFRSLEKKAVEIEGSFYFTYWRYPSAGTQIPSSVEQGLLFPNANALISVFQN